MFRPNIIPMRIGFDEKVQHFFDTFEFDRLQNLGEFLPESPDRRRELADDISVDGYGCRFKYTGVGGPYCVHHPLAGAESLCDVEAFDWPEGDPAGLIASGARQKARELRQRGQYATVIYLPRIFHRYAYLRGFEQWLIDMKLHPELHEAVADRIHRINMRLIEAQLRQVGEFTDIAAANDDFGTSTSSFMSPEDFRTFVKPYYADLIRRVKELCPHVKFYLHSHGQIMGLLEDLIDCGVDILNPILPLDNMDPVRLKHQFGDRLCYEGGIDVEDILPFGSPKQMKDHVRKVIGILMPGGGYWFKVQAVSPLVPQENLLAAYEVALECGSYDSG